MQVGGSLNEAKVKGVFRLEVEWPGLPLAIRPEGHAAGCHLVWRELFQQVEDGIMVEHLCGDSGEQE